eukprot:s2131_g4.t1
MAIPAGAGAVVAALAVDQRLQLSHDAWLAMKLVPILVGGKLRMGRDSYTIADLWQESVQRFGDRTFTIFEHRRLSFQDFEHISNQMAHFLLKQGLKTGQVCALMMENKPEYVCWWLAMAKIGVQVAMLNFNLTGKGLAHCIAVAGCSTLVFDAGTEANLHTIDSQIRETGLQLVCWGGKPHLSFSNTPAVVDYDQLMGFPYQGSNFADLRKGIKFTDVFGYIYTSGTTGLPKAAKVTHARMYGLGGIGRLLGLGPGDVLYTCLPLYHTAGGGLGAMSCFMSGATMALAKKFSAARFWREISQQQCTAFQYIGELGRYLVNYAREHPEVCEIPHKLRGAIGNGLRPEVWDEFQDKFNIPVVVEFYGATEGNGALVNICRKSDLQQRGAVGRGGFGFDLITGFKIVKFDVENETPVRGANGFCMEAAMDEPGELLFPIREDHPSKRFDGYTDPKATEKKVLRDVFKKGDSWFRSGDLLYKDAKGLWHFVDRIGDTFRWKGENVSTMEVSQVLSSLPGVEEANVYGVQVPGEADGRACMAALRGQDLQSREKLDALQSLCEKELPSYARPRFLRFLSDMDVTGTFKHQKVQLRDQGFDPAKVPDPVYILHPESKRYEPLDQEVITQLQQGRSKLK